MSHRLPDVSLAWERQKQIAAHTPRLAAVIGGASLLLLVAHMALRAGTAGALALGLVAAASGGVFFVSRRLRTDMPQPGATVVMLAFAAAAGGAGASVAAGGFAAFYPFGLLP